MSAYLSPVCNDQQCDANGAPLSGGLIYTYVGGSVNTALATYTSSTGLVQQANPIVLNSSGRATSPIWLPAGQSVKLVVQTSAGATVAGGTYDNVTGINDPAAASNVSEWVTYTGAVTYLTATTFSVVGDQTLLFGVNRRVRTANTGGTVYSTITASAFAAGITTVTVVNDSGTLDSGLSAVAYGLLAYTNPSIPGLLSSKGANGYQKLPSGVILQWGFATSSAGGAQSINFPIAFPTALGSLTITPAGTSAYSATTDAQLAASFTFSVWATAAATRVAVGAFWFAIGY